MKRKAQERTAPEIQSITTGYNNYKKCGNSSRIQKRLDIRGQESKRRFYENEGNGILGLYCYYRGITNQNSRGIAEGWRRQYYFLERHAILQAQKRTKALYRWNR